MMTTHVVQYSGGIGSWAAAQRVIAEHGTADVVLLFADTQVEDDDLYRFLGDAAEQIGVPVTVIADGRTPFEVFADTRFIGNSRLAPCSIQLKVRPCRRWLSQHTDPEDTIVYIGLDWSEPQRQPAITRGWAPWTVRYPMCDPPYLTKQDMLDWCADLGITPPRLDPAELRWYVEEALDVRARHDEEGPADAASAMFDEEEGPPYPVLALLVRARLAACRRHVGRPVRASVGTRTPTRTRQPCWRRSRASWTARAVGPWRVRRSAVRAAGAGQAAGEAEEGGRPGADLPGQGGVAGREAADLAAPAGTGGREPGPPARRHPNSVRLGRQPHAHVRDAVR